MNTIFKEDLIFFEYEDRKGEVICFDMPFQGTSQLWKNPKVVVLLGTEEFKKYTKQLRTVQDKIFRNLKPGHYGPRPCYEDVKDIEVYKFIHEKIVELKDIPSKEISGKSGTGLNEKREASASRFFV